MPGLPEENKDRGGKARKEIAGMKATVYIACSQMPFAQEGLPWGGSIVLGETEQEIDYDELAAVLNLDAVADMLHVPRGSVSILTPEEYEEKYGKE